MERTTNSSVEVPVDAAIAAATTAASSNTYHNMQLEDITVDAVQTLGEKMTNAALNTLMGMGVVFAVLILISLIIRRLLPEPGQELLLGLPELPPGLLPFWVQVLLRRLRHFLLQ